MTTTHPALRRGTLNGLELKNRLLKAGTFENLTPGGVPGDRLAAFHNRLAEGRLAMTTLGYCAVENAGRLNANMMVMDEDTCRPLQGIIQGLHERGCKVSGQMGHCGAFSKNHSLQQRPKGPSGGLNILGFSEGMWFANAMSLDDIDKLVAQYGRAAALMKDTGFDAVEIHFGHGYGLCQFLSPLTNHRKDEYGGSLENRLRLPLRVLAAVRQAVGEDFPILGKISLSEGRRGGLHYDDAVEISKALDQAGIDGLVTSGGTSTFNPMLMFRGDSILPALLRHEKNRWMRLIYRLMGKRMFPSMPYRELYFLEQAKRVREAVSCNMIHIGGASTAESFEQALEAGFDFIQLGRSLLADPDLPTQLAGNSAFKSRCTHCNACVGTIESERGIHCPVFNP
ncbi:NADH:flavin oxidoreductase [Spongiibacter nanhainus]|uniref:NADH:flavin oxidoreductase n=1 Tax=Spongiibacter nanhainus TaxID=2794344 RepID=A0A7T4R0D3_9GAMM|nr:NADH:flavin oxidoreductase [Spongiibacter nanhainus]QQD18114.1 NADH:flavin oxidoreductase [Spongiibacter nanhainus]